MLHNMVTIKEGVEKFLSEGTGVLKIELFLSFVEPFSYFSKVLYLFNFLFLVALVFIPVCGLSLVAACRDFSLLQCMGFSLW